MCEPARAPDRFRPKEHQVPRPRLIGTVINPVRRACNRHLKTRTRGTEGRVPAPDGAIAIEWGNDLESLEFKWTDWHGSEQEARVTGRCANRWRGFGQSLAAALAYSVLLLILYLVVRWLGSDLAMIVGRVAG